MQHSFKQSPTFIQISNEVMQAKQWAKKQKSCYYGMPIMDLLTIYRKAINTKNIA